MPPAELEAARLDSPRWFEQEYGASFLSVEGAEWPPEYFPNSMWVEQFPRDLTAKVIAVDPSKGKDAKSGDYSAIVKLARCSEGLLWCEADLARRTAERIIEDVIEHQRVFGADVVAVESNQFQELLAVQIHAESRRQGVPLPVTTPVNTVNKQVRIRRLGPHLARKSFRFLDTPGTRILVEQLRAFPEAEFDDGPDAAELALRALIELVNGRQQKRHPQRVSP